MQTLVDIQGVLSAVDGALEGGVQLNYAEVTPFLGTYFVSGDSWILSIPPDEEQRRGRASILSTTTLVGIQKGT